MGDAVIRSKFIDDLKGAIIWCFVHQVILLKPAGITQN